ncbi:MAG: hypothetical protein ACO24Y_05795 [Hylemonella sp.]
MKHHEPTQAAAASQTSCKPLRWSWPVASLLLLGMLLGAISQQQARSADAPKPAAASAKAGAANSVPALPANSYTVKKGDTLDKLVYATYQGSPLKPEILRNAVLQANPQLGKGKTVSLRPGSQMLLPEHGEIIMATLSPYLPPPPPAAAEPPAAVPPSDPIARRDWIRFP